MKKRTVKLTMPQIAQLCRQHIYQNRDVFMIDERDQTTNTVFRVDHNDDLEVEMTVEVKDDYT